MSSSQTSPHSPPPVLRSESVRRDRPDRRTTSTATATAAWTDASESSPPLGATENAASMMCLLLRVRRRDQMPLRRLPISAGSALSRNVDDQRIALTTAAAQGGDAAAPASALEFEGEGEDDAGTGSADRVTERHGASVDVDLVLVDAEVLGTGQTDSGECLVDLVEIEGVRGHAFAFGCGPDRLRGLVLQGRIGTGGPGVGADLGEDRCADP